MTANILIVDPCCGGQAGKYVSSDVTRSLIVVITNVNDLQGYTVRTLYRAFQAWDGQVPCYTSLKYNVIQQFVK